jgi:hypothetical protein
LKYKGLLVLVDELIKQGKLLHLALYASSEAVRGIKKMKQPALESSSVAEFTSIFYGSYFKGEMDPMEAYGLVKYGATLWMSYMARKHPGIKVCQHESRWNGRYSGYGRRASTAKNYV